MTIVASVVVLGLVVGLAVLLALCIREQRTLPPPEPTLQELMAELSASINYAFEEIGKALLPPLIEAFTQIGDAFAALHESPSRLGCGQFPTPGGG